MFQKLLSYYLCSKYSFVGLSCRVLEVIFKIDLGQIYFVLLEDCC